MWRKTLFQLFTCRANIYFIMTSIWHILGIQGHYTCDLWDIWSERKHDLTNKKTMTKTNKKTMTVTMTTTNTLWEQLHSAMFQNCDFWDIWDLMRKHDQQKYNNKDNQISSLEMNSCVQNIHIPKSFFVQLFRQLEISRQELACWKWALWSAFITKPWCLCSCLSSDSAAISRII